MLRRFFEVGENRRAETGERKQLMGIANGLLGTFGPKYDTDGYLLVLNSKR